MKLEDIKTGDEVVYIPKYLLTGDKNQMIKEENLEIVTSKNDYFVFVLFKGKNGSQATKAEDLFALRNRPDLIAKLS